MIKINQTRRNGAVTPLFAILLPVIFILCGFAINLAHMQLTSAQLKIATDASAHAGGRAMSIEQETAPAVALAQQIANANLVGGRVLTLTTEDTDDDIQFGSSTRTGTSRFSFNRHSQEDVDSGSERATSFAVSGSLNIPLLFTAMPGPMTRFDASRRSVATQVDRDIALVIDRSGSMLFYEDETALSNTLYLLYAEGVEVLVSEGTPPTEAGPDYEVYAFYGRIRDGEYRRFKGYYTIEEGESQGWVYDPSDHYTEDGDPGSPGTDPVYETQYPIGEDEYDDATDDLYNRRYSDNIIEQLATESEKMAQYAGDWETMMESSSDWNDRTPAPRHSRWAFLVDGVDAFLSVLEGTDQEERVALVTFNSGASLTDELSDTYANIRSTVAGIVPYSGTGIGGGMLAGHPEIISGTNARPFAAKTIVVLTDGENNPGQTTPTSAATTIVAANAVTIHTMTFATDNQDAKNDMENTADNGNGRYYHASSGADLILKFREIANNLPTILTE